MGYLDYMRHLDKKRRTSTPNQSIEPVGQSRYLDYLQDLKSRSEHHHASSMDWEKDMKDLTSSRL